LAVAPSLSTRLPSAATPTSASYACWCSLLSTSRRHVNRHGTHPEHDSKQASQAETTEQKIEEMEPDELIRFIQQKKPKLPSVVPFLSSTDSSCT